jgi:hypothetical protein
MADFMMAFFHLQLMVIALASLLIAVAYLLFLEMNNADKYRKEMIRQRQRRAN